MRAKAKGMSDLLTLCDKLTARNPLSTSKWKWDKALEIVLDEGGRVFFIRSGLGACACGITDDADPDLKKELAAELATRDLDTIARLFIIDEDDPDVSDGIEELKRLSDLAMCGGRFRRTITWPEGKVTVPPLKKKKKKKNRGWE